MHTYIYIYIYRERERDIRYVAAWEGDNSEGGMMRLETLIELKCLNSSFSNLSSYRN